MVFLFYKDIHTLLKPYLSLSFDQLPVEFSKSFGVGLFLPVALTSFSSVPFFFFFERIQPNQTKFSFSLELMEMKEGIAYV